jgi:hypothetical protein
MAELMLGVGAYAAANPSPAAIYSAAQMFFMIEVPFPLVMTAIIIPIGSLHSWLSNIKHPISQVVAISDDSIVFSGADASGAFAWTVYTSYKETPWSFIL